MVRKQTVVSWPKGSIHPSLLECVREFNTELDDPTCQQGFLRGQTLVRYSLQ
jgi:hypothetical protein